MSVISRLLTVAACSFLSGCGQPQQELPPLLRGATTTGGSNLLCEGGNEPGAKPETASHSPEIVARLRASYRPGSSASQLRSNLLRQGFTIHNGCSTDRSVSWAEFRQKATNGLDTYTAAFGTVYWRQDATGRLLWATGDIAYTGL